MKHLQADLESLERNLLTMSSMVEEMIEKATRALRDGQADLIRDVRRLETAVDDREVSIEEGCLKTLALHQPVAVDLRRTAAILKSNNDLERIADLAVNICERAEGIRAYPEFPLPDLLERMSQHAVAMVHDALDAFVHWNAVEARAVCLRDEVIVDYNRRVFRDLYEVMRTQPKLIEPALHFFSAARHLERIGDHATNIAEDVIYLVEGRITRHRHEEVHAQ